MTLNEAKSYLRAGNDEDDLINSLILAAAQYINGKTGKTKIIIEEVEQDISTDELYNLACKLIIAHWYENRGVEIAGTLTKITHSVDALVNHIAMCSDYT